MEDASKLQTSVHGFDTLAECEVAYDRLQARYAMDTERAEDMPNGRGRDIGLEDEDGPLDPDQHVQKRDYKPPEDWDYSQHGEDWTNFGECGAGGQSPIDLDKYIDVKGQTKYVLWFDYFEDPNLKPSTVAHLVNDGHSLRYNVAVNNVDLGFVKIGNEEYAASDYIFHAPSEHTVDGAVFPLELQIYNKAREGNGIVAISIFFKEGPSNPMLAGMMNSMKEGPSWFAGKGSATGALNGTFAAAFDLENVIPKGGVNHETSFYNYEGSLTQPPCTTGVDWWVLSVPITASRDEIRFVRKAIFGSDSMPHGNARSTHPMGDRSLFVGLTGFQSQLKGHTAQVFSAHPDTASVITGYSSKDRPWGSHWKDESGPAPGPAPSMPNSPAAGVAASPE